MHLSKGDFFNDSPSNMSHHGPLEVFLPHQAKKCISLHCTVMLFPHFLSGLFEEKLITGRKNMQHMKFRLKCFPQIFTNQNVCKPLLDVKSVLYFICVLGLSVADQG